MNFQMLMNAKASLVLTVVHALMRSTCTLVCARLATQIRSVLQVRFILLSIGEVAVYIVNDKEGMHIGSMTL